MSKIKVLWVVFLGVLVVVLGVFTWQKNQGKAPVDKVDKAKQTYNPAEHFPNVPFDKDSNYYKHTVPNSDLVYYSPFSTSTVKPNLIEIDTARKGMMKIHENKISISMPNEFAIEPAIFSRFIYPLKNNRNIQIDVSVFPGVEDCSNNSGYLYNIDPIKFNLKQDTAIAYSKVLNRKPEYRETSALNYKNSGLVFRMNRPEQITDSNDSTDQVTLYPCVQIFPNPEDPELKKNHPEIYPEVQEVVKTIVESIRPIE